MPRYDYKCRECGYETEHQHSFKETPEFQCPNCENSILVKFFTNLNFSVPNTRLKRAMNEKRVRELEIRQDLQENHMIEGVQPIGARSIEQVHKEVKASGSMVKEHMQRTIEENENKTRKKQKEWKIGANRRVEQRTIEARKKRAEEEAAKRKITVSKKK